MILLFLRKKKQLHICPLFTRKGRTVSTFSQHFTCGETKTCKHQRSIHPKLPLCYISNIIIGESHKEIIMLLHAECE